AFSPDGRTLASASRDYTVKLWDVAGAKVRANLQGHQGGPRGVAFAPDGKTVASAGWTQPDPKDATKFVGEVRLWDVATGKFQTTLKGHKAPLFAVAFAPDGKTLASASAADYDPWLQDGVKLWDLGKQKVRAALEHPAGVFVVAFAPDGKTLATGCWDKTVR